MIFEIASAVVGTCLYSSICFGTQAVLMFYDFACLNEASTLFPAQLEADQVRSTSNATAPLHLVVPPGF